MDRHVGFHYNHRASAIWNGYPAVGFGRIQSDLLGFTLINRLRFVLPPRRRFSQYPATTSFVFLDRFIWVRFLFHRSGVFHNMLQSRLLIFSIWVRFVKKCFLTGTSPTRNVHFPMENDVFRFWSRPSFGFVLHICRIAGIVGFGQPVLGSSLFFACLPAFHIAFHCRGKDIAYSLSCKEKFAVFSLIPPRRTDERPKSRGRRLIPVAGWNCTIL